MARLWTSGAESGNFEWNSSYSAGVSISSSYARTGSYSIRTPYYVDSTYFQQMLSEDKTEIYWRLALYTFGLALDFDVIEFRDSDGAVQCELRFDYSTQTLRARNGAGTIYTGGQGTLTLSSNQWYVLEGHLVVDDAAGEFTVKVNGTTDLSATSVDTDYTNQGAVRAVRFCNCTSGLGTAELAYYDDIAINDTDGSYQNTWIGLGGVYLLKPDGDGATTDFTPSAGTVHYELMDETPRNTTDWTQGTATGNTELVDVEACPTYVNTVDLAEVIYQAAIVESGSQDVVDVVRLGTVNYTGSTVTFVSIVPDYVYTKGTVHYINPASGSAWLTTDIDSIQGGVQIA